MAEVRGDQAVKAKLVVSGNATFEKGSKVPYLEVIDNKAEGEAGGTFTGHNPGSQSWRTRDLTFIAFNDFATTVVVASNPGEGGSILLEKGVYYCDIFATAFYVNDHTARLADVTDNPGADGATLITGSPENSPSSRDSWHHPSQTRSVIKGQFQLTAQRTLEIQHRCLNTRLNDGFGKAANFYETNNVFTKVEMWIIRADQ